MGLGRQGEAYGFFSPSVDELFHSDARRQAHLRLYLRRLSMDKASRAQRDKGEVKRKRKRRQEEIGELKDGRKDAESERQRERERKRRGLRCSRERMDSASGDVLLTVMSLSSPKVPRRHCINLLLPTSPYWKFYRALHSFCRGRLLYYHYRHRHHRVFQPATPIGELPCASTCVLPERRGEESLAKVVSVDMDASEASTRWSITLSITGIGKSPALVSGGGTHTRTFRTPRWARMPTAESACIRFAINASAEGDSDCARGIGLTRSVTTPLPIYRK